MTERMKIGGTKIDLLVGEMTRAHVEIARILGELQTALDRLSAEWSGDAQRAYAQAQTRWNGIMKELHDELDRVQRRTHESNDVFANAQRSTQRLWSE